MSNQLSIEPTPPAWLLPDFQAQILSPLLVSFWLGKSLVFSPNTEVRVQPIFNTYCKDLSAISLDLGLELKPVSRISFYRQLEKMLEQGYFDQGPSTVSFLSSIPPDQRPKAVRRVKGKTYKNVWCDPSRIGNSQSPLMFDESFWPSLENHLNQFQCQRFIQALKRRYDSEADWSWDQVLRKFPIITWFVFLCFRSSLSILA